MARLHIQLDEEPVEPMENIPEGLQECSGILPDDQWAEVVRNAKKFAEEDNG